MGGNVKTFECKEKFASLAVEQMMVPLSNANPLQPKINRSTPLGTCSFEIPSDRPLGGRPGSHSAGGLFVVDLLGRKFLLGTTCCGICQPVSSFVVF